MRWRIRSQLLVPSLLLLLGVAGISTWTAIASANRARRQVETRLRAAAEELVARPRSWNLTERILEQVKGLSGADYLLMRPEGTPLDTLGGVVVELPADAVGDDWRSLRLGPPVKVGDETYLCSGIHITQPPDAGATLYILYPQSLWRDALWEAVWPSLVLGGGLGLASVGLALGLGQHLSRRIQELERRTRLIAGGDFSPMPLPARDDELRDLAGSVNEMAQRLAKFQETVRRTERLRLLGQVSGGLAHQLRNGLTGVRLAIQLYAREVAGQTDTAPLDVALRQLALLEAHLKRFLDLGREDARRREPCSLTDLTGEAVELVRPQCRHASIDLCWQPPADPHTIPGDPGQLGQLLLNVLGNAVEAAGPGGEVLVTVTRSHGLMADHSPGANTETVTGKEGRSGVVVEVWDSGSGPAADVAERVFEPFVTGKPEGVGLGLAVAQQVAQAHGGRIGWRRENDRTCFRIELPDGPELAAPVSGR